MNRELIFKYCEWGHGCSCEEHNSFVPHYRQHALDSNDMTAAMNKMQKRGEWKNFYSHCFIRFIQQKGYTHEFYSTPIELFAAYTNYLFQPDRFFELMSEALEKGVIGK